MAGLWYCGNTSYYSGSRVSDQQCVYLLEAKNCEYEAKYSWAGC